MFKEYPLPKDSFIGGWFITKQLCDKLTNYYNEFLSHTKPGRVAGYQVSGDFGKVDKSRKNSVDLKILPTNVDKEILEYAEVLQTILKLYINKYPEVNSYPKFNFESANIQKYPKKGGFKKWHFERTNKNLSNRVLVFMTYLNDIEKGGTMFKYQKIITPSKKGLTLIWPSDFTHTHKSEVVDKEKMIITGWFSII
jgi:hypothetical protein